MPARAPPSMDMLQSVIRPSMFSPRIADPVYSMTRPCSACRSDLRDDVQDDVLRRDAFLQLTVNGDLEILRLALQQALAGEHMADFRCADAESQSAERAMRGSVAVAADDGLAGLRHSKFRTDDVDDALLCGCRDRRAEHQIPGNWLSSLVTWS